MWCLGLFLWFAPALLAQDSPSASGTEPKSKAIEYPVHAKAGALEIGGEFWVHTFRARGQSFFTEDYLVVEVAVYSSSRAPVELRAGRFTLRVNGKKHGLLPDAPGMVAASLQYGDWERRREVIATAGAGAGEVAIGRPRQVERFPGDPRPTQTRLPTPPRAPSPEDRSGVAPSPKASPWDAALEAALPEGDRVLPVSGYLFYRHKGKVKSAELHYTGPEGPAALMLKPAVR